jgi:site-specific DNA-methyltransferase (adenine-specific)
LLGIPVENVTADFTTYDLIKENNEEKINRLKDMKFDVIVGNPPYQKSNGGGLNKSSGTAIYDDFVTVAKSLSPRFINMIMPSRWFAVQGGKLETFRNTMLEDKHISTLHDYNNAEDCFGKSVELKGGVCYFLRDTEHNGDCNVNIHCGNEITSETRALKNQHTEVYVRYQKYLDILQKVQNIGESSFSTIVSPNDPFGFDSRIEGTMRRVKVNPSLKPIKDGVEFYYHGWRTKGIGFVKRESVKRNKEWIDKVKVLIPKAWGIGDTSKDFLTPLIVSNPSCCYETYLIVGPFEIIAEAKNVVKYMQTKFFHLLVAILKNTQNAMQGAYKYVPLQDFTSDSDIDWSKSVAEIGQQLYAKYGLDESEIAFIESKIKPM